jgi:hypothetical protein
LSKYTHVEADITNNEKDSIKIGCRVDNPGATGKANQSGSKVTVEPNSTATVRVELNRNSVHDFQEILKGMSAFPDGTKDGSTIDPANVIAVQFFGFRPTQDQSFVVDNIRATGKFDKKAFEAPLPEPFMPFIDQFGQYIHKDWPGKTHSIADLKEKQIEEDQILSQAKANPDFNKYGGFAAGPQLEATGSFRTEQYKGKWWLVDPNGRLFWSFGSCCVRTGTTTAVGNRDGWFKDLPAEDDKAFKSFYGSKTLTRGDYKGQELKTFDFGNSNLYKKYGENWKDISDKRAIDRFNNWGLNTFACWSDAKTFELNRMPYTHWVFYRIRNIRVWGMTHKPFPDFFDPNFEKTLGARANNMAGRYKDDPHCIGFFVDNEIPWGTSTTIGKIALKAPADQPAKLRIIKMLKDKYSTIEKLNESWGTKHDNWEVFNKPIIPPEAARADLEDYCRITAEHYYSTCARVMKKVAPNKLYLGSRFAQYNSIVVEVANKYCDVVSFNLYVRTVKSWSPPVQLDKPVIIGEFHFGAKDRGPFAHGLVGTENQQDRADSIKSYINGALQNPLIIGAHWFQYRDEPTTGRTLDNESHQIGLVDVCDTPYEETINAIQEVSTTMYETRLSK